MQWALRHDCGGRGGGRQCSVRTQQKQDLHIVSLKG